MEEKSLEGSTLPPWYMKDQGKVEWVITVFIQTPVVSRMLNTWNSFLVVWGKKFSGERSGKVFLVKLSKVRTVTLEQLVAMSSPLNKCAVIWVIAELCTVCQNRVITKTKQLIRKVSWILWRWPLFQLLFLATRLTKQPSFDWLKSHSPLFESQ